MNRFERWFLMRVFKRQLTQGYGHFDNLQELFRMIYWTWAREFTEDNRSTHDTCMRDALERTLVTTRKEQP